MFCVTWAYHRFRIATCFVLALALLLPFNSFAVASGVALVRLSVDPYTNQSSQHRTEVEPDNFSYGSTIVNTFQSGRFFNGGASNNGWATSTDNGATWTNGFLPGITRYATPPGTYDRASDPSVTYDAAHNTWLISSLAILNHKGGQPLGAAVLVNRSTDGGHTWSNPVAVSNNGGSAYFDKDWIVCDNTSASPYYGHCYVEYDNVTQNLLMQMVTSTDGGLSWGSPLATADNAAGIDGQPLVQPGGTVIVPFLAQAGNIAAFSSTNGGASWNSSVEIAPTHAHHIHGHMRSETLPSAEIDGAGNVYVVWQSCLFENNCSANDVVMSVSPDGIHWSAVQRVPTEPVGSGVEHFIPGIAVDKTTSGNSAHVAITYYYYPNVNCTKANCQLDVGYITSINGGASWSSKTQLAGPMAVTWLANTNQGYMVGDYISTEIINGKAFPIFAVASAPKGKFNESIFTVSGGLALSGGSNLAQQALPIHIPLQSIEIGRLIAN